MNTTVPIRRARPVTTFRAELVESLHMALHALAAHKLRTVLTLLGVVVGVFSIIMVMTAMRALQSNIEGELSQLGAYTFTIEKWPPINFDGPQGSEKYWRRKNISLVEVRALRDRATLAASVGAATDYLKTREAISRFERTNPDVPLRGVTPEAFAARNWIIEEGRAFNSTDLDSARNVCVLGNGLVKKLFPRGGSPLGEIVKFDGVNYTLIGYIEAKGGMAGQDQDNYILIPITTALNRYGATYRTLNIYVQSPTREQFDDTLEQVRGVLRSVRKVPPGAPDDFEIYSSDSLIEQFRSLTLAVRVGVAVVSSIALIAAGIGIMNIMLVSVTERTREIGVRRAIGAKKRNIITQFILEAVMLCELGGLIGVALGIAGGNVAAWYLKMPPVIPVDWVFIGLALCSAVGLIFGTYPAIKAANLDPVESLRYE